MLGGVAAGLHQLQLHLQRGVAQQTGKLGLGLYLGGHKVQHKYLQGADILCHGPGLGHYEDILVGEHLGGGKLIGYLDRHGYVLR